MSRPCRVPGAFSSAATSGDRIIWRGNTMRLERWIGSALWLERAIFDHLTGLNGQNGLRTGGHKWQQILRAIGLGAQDDDRDTASTHVLLILDIAIAGEKDVPAALGNGQKFAVSLGAKTGLPVWLSWLIAVRVPCSSLGRHSSIKILILRSGQEPATSLLPAQRWLARG